MWTLHVSSFYLTLANENRYEGSWLSDKKHGPGKYYYLDKGQMYEGTWSDDIARCGKMVDFGRDKAPTATQYPIPQVSTKDIKYGKGKGKRHKQ